MAQKIALHELTSDDIAYIAGFYSLTASGQPAENFPGESSKGKKKPPQAKPVKTDFLDFEEFVF